MQAYPTGCCALDAADLYSFGVATAEGPSSHTLPVSASDPATLEVAAGIFAWVVASINRP